MRYLLACFVACAMTVSALGQTATKVLLRFETAQPRVFSDAELQGSGATRLIDYEAFSLVRAQNIPALTKAAEAAGVALENLNDEWDRLLLSERTIDTRITGPEPFTVERGLYVMQFVGPLLPDWNDALALAGLEYVDYIPNNGALLAGTRESALGFAAAHKYVQWVSEYTSSMKRQPTPCTTEARRWGIQLAWTPKTRTNAAAIANPLALRRDFRYRNYRNIEADLTCAEVTKILHDPWVISVEPRGTEMLSGEREAISSTKQRSDNPTTTVFHWYDAAGAWRPFRPGTTFDYRNSVATSIQTNAATHRIAVADSGLNGGTHGYGHPDLTNDTWYLDYYGEYGQDPLSHGTAVAGLAVGRPAAPSQSTATDIDATVDPAMRFAYGMGLTPWSSLLVQRITNGETFVNVPIATIANDAYMNGCTIQTHSHNEYGAGADGAYNQTAQEYDEFVRDTYGNDGNDTPMPMTISVGNIGENEGDYTTMVLPPATAKNVISVGGAESYRPGITACDQGLNNRPPGWLVGQSLRNVAIFSRRGTRDGRIKPDILAPASVISTTASQNPGASPYCVMRENNLYLIDSGTSFAAPQIAGAAVLIDAKFNTRFTPAMLKAVLLGNALSMNGGMDKYTSTVVGPRPNPTQGFGRYYMGCILAGCATSIYHDEPSFVAFTAGGQQRSGTAVVQDATKPVILVLAWTDEPGSTAGGKALVRDLDLEVRDGSARYTGNQMVVGSEYSQRQTSSYTYDSLNNVEMIVIPAGTLSQVNYYITCRTWGWGTHAQKFALWISNAV